MALLSEPHVQPLTEYLERLRAERGTEDVIPAFGPLDGGISASALSLLEAPGPQAVNSGFVSRNNPDPTARNLNVLFANDVRVTIPYLLNLPSLLPRLEAIVLVGQKAQSAAEQIRLTTVLLSSTPHFSALVVNA